ncbi:unnamed protein product [Dovyalis caffra]|uniref:Uncharacterized protein n=1 Tax=Dovyalis caffra TaxID=77055 RepID=A0AAV1SR25_9ROSI|nr:unnamed protein product [Dovyalis caffra]
MSAPVVHYEFHVELKPFQRELMKFPVLFLFGEVHYLMHITERLMEFRRAREPLIIRKLAQIPVGDSLLDHIQDFKDILTGVDIPEVEQSKIGDEIAAKALDMDTYNGTFIEDITRDERESMKLDQSRPPSRLLMHWKELFNVTVAAIKCPVEYLEHITEGLKVFRRAKELFIVSKLAKIPINDSLYDHIQDFKEILTKMDIPETKHSKIMDEIASKAHGMNTYNGSFMSVRIEKVIFRHTQNAVNNKEKVARVEGKSSDV